MPGGSGLLEQMLARWRELIAAAKSLLAGCPGGCDSACYSRASAHFYDDLVKSAALRPLV